MCSWKVCRALTKRSSLLQQRCPDPASMANRPPHSALNDTVGESRLSCSSEWSRDRRWAGVVKFAFLPELRIYMKYLRICSVFLFLSLGLWRNCGWHRCTGGLFLAFISLCVVSNGRLFCFRTPSPRTSSLLPLPRRLFYFTKYSSHPILIFYFTEQ